MTENETPYCCTQDAPCATCAEDMAEGCTDCGDTIDLWEDDGTPWCGACFHSRGGEDAPHGELQPIIDRMESYGDGMDPPDMDAFLEMDYEDRFAIAD